MKPVARDIVRALDALSNETRLRIVNELNDRSELSFSSLLKALDIEKATLTFHLKKLTAGGIVEHFFRHTLGDDKYSFYGLTNFGKRLFLMITDALIPQPIVSEETPTTIADFYGEHIEGVETKLNLPEMSSGLTAYTIAIDSQGDTIIVTCIPDKEKRIMR